MEFNKPGPRIIDITAPDKSAPAPNSRPVVVSNRPILTNDPMMVADEPTVTDEADSGISPISRQAKTITPLESSAPEAPKVEAADTELAAEPSTEPAAETDVTKPELPAEKPADTDPIPPAVDSAKSDTQQADEAAAEKDVAEKSAATQQAAADTAREQELAQLVASGKYQVPINAVHRRQHRLAIIAGSVLVVAAVVIVAFMLRRN